MTCKLPARVRTRQHTGHTAYVYHFVRVVGLHLVLRLDGEDLLARAGAPVEREGAVQRAKPMFEQRLGQGLRLPVFCRCVRAWTGSELRGSERRYNRDNDYDEGKEEYELQLNLVFEPDLHSIEERVAGCRVCGFLRLLRHP